MSPSVLRDPSDAVERALAAARDPARLAVLRRTGLLDAGIQESLQRFARLATELTGAPMSAVSLLDAGRQYFAAEVNLGLAESPLEASYCKHVVADDIQLAVSDAREDAVLAENLATRELGVRAYLGSPIEAGGQRLGAFCLVDTEVHEWGERERRIVDDLAAAVATDIELRLRAAEQEQMALTDGLTGLGNRRAMALHLEQALASGASLHLALLDLDGFKAYNDAFGHPAGDELLSRLSGRLAAAVGEQGGAFRMGGDEFCVLVEDSALLVAARQALADQGPGFRVSASIGYVQVPGEAADATTAIGIADTRLYGSKRSRPGSVDHQLSAALAVALAERDGELAGRSDGISRLAREIAVSLGVRGEDVGQVAIAARLHDIGKMAISDAILHKRGPLDPDEWDVMKRHTIIGERILAAAPALTWAARLVRSSHERWDGRGYPDRLAGEEIPLGARIIFACDAFDAITSGRPYRGAAPETEALAELERCAGSQFDPRVVAALVEAIAPALT